MWSLHSGKSTFLNLCFFTHYIYFYDYDSLPVYTYMRERHLLPPLPTAHFSSLA